MWRVSAVSWRRQNIKDFRHDNVVRYIHWQLCGKCELERANNRNEKKPEGVVESENFKIVWDFTIQCDRKIEARRPDIVTLLIRRRERLSLLMLPSQVMMTG